MKKIIIIGKGAGWELAPLEGETWGVNDLCFRRPVSVIFNMHADGCNSLCNKINAFAERTRTPLIKLDNYPLYEMHTDYFTNSISFMIAYAIREGATHIDMYGCNMQAGSEYAFQKPCVEYWIGYARGRGVEVNLSGSTNLMQSGDGNIYGYDIKQTREVNNG